MQPCSINKTESNSFDDKGVFNGVAGGAGYFRHDGTFFVEYGIQQGGLTYIRFADDSHGNTILKYIAQRKGTCEFGEFVFNHVQ